MTNDDATRLLLIEDDAGVRRSLQLLLHGERFEVHAFSSAATALAHFAIWQPTYVVIDYVLPDSNGIEVLGKMRAQGWSGPAVLITAFDSENLRKQADAAGFSALLSKPFAELRLVEALRRGSRSVPASGPQ